MKNIAVILLIILVVFACSTKKEYKTPESLIKANAEYMNEEDLEGVMTTVHPKSPSYDGTEAMAKQIFDRYDLNYKIENIKVLEENDKEAKVEFTQVTTKIKGKDFKNNKATGIHTLRKDGDSWKVYSTEMVNVEFLDKDDFHN
jgi:PBP1b-binding outer membrane lipoprotein LpoB